MNSHDRPGPATNAAPVDFSSRIEKRLWLLHKGSDQAEARMCVKFGRRDFRVYVNGQLLWSRNFAFDASEAFDEHAAAKCAEFLADQWVAPGQPPSGA